MAAEAEALRQKEEEAKRAHEAKIAAAKDAAAAEELRKAELIREAQAREAERQVRVKAEKLRRAKEKAAKDKAAAEAFAAFDVPKTRLSDVQPPTPQKLTTQLSGGFNDPRPPPPPDDEDEEFVDDEAGPYFSVLFEPYAIDATRRHLPMTWVVSILILSRFGPRRV